MTSSNRVRLTGVAEATYGETPANPRMRKQRTTSIALTYKSDSVESDDIRDDRMSSDPVIVGQTNGGQLGVDWHWPPDGSLLSEEIQSAFCDVWANTPARDNDGTADSVITGVTASTQVVTVASGPAFVAGHLVYFSGFGLSANRNKLAKVTTGSTTAPAFLGAGLVDEAAPAAGARLKVVGFEGAVGDLTALADGIGSTALDLTAFGLAPGRWVKIGGLGAGFRFATDKCNVWARVSGTVTATKIPMDNLPAGWAADDGAGKTIRVFIGDWIKNGVAKYGLTLERGFMGQTTPTYIKQTGMRVNTLEFGGQAKQKATGSIAFMGLIGGRGPVSLDATPDEAPDSNAYPILAFSANCGSVREGGGALGTPNYAKAIKFTINNNLRAIDAISTGDDFAPASVDVQDGSFDVAVELDTFFGNDVLLGKVMDGTPTALNTRLEKAGKALIWEAPRLIPREGDPSVGGKNQDVMLPLRLTGSKDSLTNAQLILNRFEYFQ